ncbi:hypothetical protein [Streptosporangium sp. NPDC051022]|uniref:hypothetical protein n=1 Tax=Streptosporangium sp. NPDC051022 TaxID=3155752 RepID=UPI00342A78D9
MDIDEILDHGPIGRWRTASGTAIVLVGDEMVFARDGTGRLFTHSVAFGTETLEFRWRMLSRTRLWIRPTDADEDEDGTVVSVETRSHETDTGRHTVLAETGQSGFWLLLDPLERIGDD